MGFLSQKIERSEVVAGDHIYTWRAAFTYSHHGIYIGKSRVVHFIGTFGSSSVPFSWSSFAFSDSTSSPLDCPNFPYCGFRHPGSAVVLSCFDCFLANGSLFRFEYGVSKYKLLLQLRDGTCTTAKSDPPEVVIHRALYLLQHGFGDYNVMRNNCEHFAMYCKTGLVCIIGGSGQASVFQVPILAAGAYTVMKRLAFVASMVMTIATTTGTYLVSRYCNDFGVRVDVMKVPVEVLVLSRGSVRQSSFRASQTSDPSPTEITESDGHSTFEATGSFAGFLTNVSSSTTTDSRTTNQVDEGSVASTIDEIIKELEQPTNAANANDLLEMDETLRSCAQTIKDKFVKKLVEMDPLAPKQMITLANSCLNFLSEFPFDVDSLYFSVKDFVVQAHELARAKQDVNLCCLDFNNTQLLEKTCEQIEVLTEERNRLAILWSKAIDDQIKQSSSRLSVLEGERESEDAYFQNIKSNLKQTSKELSDASNLMDGLVMVSLFNSSEQYAQLADLEAALGDARFRLLS